jgi:hypothetical protein
MGQRVIFPWGDEEQGGGGNRPQAGSSWADTVHCKLLMIHTDSFTEVEGNQKRKRSEQGVTKRCRLFWLANSVLVSEPKCGGRGGRGGCGVAE